MRQSAVGSRAGRGEQADGKGRNGGKFGQGQTVSRLKRKALKQGVQRAGQRFDRRLRGELPLPDGPLQAVGKQAFSSLPQLTHSGDDLRLVLGDVDGRQHHHAATGRVGRKQDAGRIPKEMLHGHVHVGLFLKAAGRAVPVGMLIMAERLKKKGGLVAECGVQAGGLDAHGLAQLRHGSGRVAPPPEDL